MTHRAALDVAQPDGSGPDLPVASVDQARPTPRPHIPLRLLVFTSLYPNAALPRQGLFVEARLRKLVASGRITATVIAPVPWFPFAHPRFGTYAKYARVPRQETRHGIAIAHPRYPVIPKLGMNVASALMYHAVRRSVRQWLSAHPAIDLIDAHYLYPDSVAAVQLGAWFGKPVVITARGSDVTLLPRYRIPRQKILWAAAHAARIVTVSRALATQLGALGVHPEKLTTLRNGVDLERFRPLERSVIRDKLGIAGCVWLTVGHLVELKGVHLAIAALAHTDAVTLLVVGEGPERAHLQTLATSLGVAARVRFVGAVAHAELAPYYNAADALLQPSSREGMPNVVLEALACGTPVIAAPFAGASELISAAEAGEIASERSAEAIAAAWQHLHGRMPSRDATRQFAEQLGWEPVVEAQCALYARVLAECDRQPSATGTPS